MTNWKKESKRLLKIKNEYYNELRKFKEPLEIEKECKEKLPLIKYLDGVIVFDDCAFELHINNVNRIYKQYSSSIVIEYIDRQGKLTKYETRYTYNATRDKVYDFIVDTIYGLK